jgi:hypothetical protein
MKVAGVVQRNFLSAAANSISASSCVVITRFTLPAGTRARSTS